MDIPRRNPSRRRICSERMTCDQSKTDLAWEYWLWTRNDGQPPLRISRVWRSPNVSNVPIGKNIRNMRERCQCEKCSIKRFQRQMQEKSGALCKSFSMVRKTPPEGGDFAKNFTSELDDDPLLKIMPP